MTEQQRSTYYIGIGGTPPGLFMTQPAEILDPTSHVPAATRAAWRVDGAESIEHATACVMLDAAGQYLGSDITVTRIIPRPPTADERLDAARSQLRADYWNDVRGVVDDVKLDIERRNLTTEDEVSEYIDQACDGHERVIYTGQAIECLLFTRNDDAYFDQYCDYPDTTDGMQWTLLASMAFRADVSDELGNATELLEEAAPDHCEDCGDELPKDRDSDLCVACDDAALVEDGDKRI